MKRTAIVFCETGERDGKAFDVYLEGANPAWDTLTPEEQLTQLSPAEFWWLRAFQIVTGIMQESGVIQTISKPS